MGRLLRLLAKTGPSAPPAAPAATTLARNSAWLGGVNAAPDYYTIPAAGLAYPDSDWAEILCIKFNFARTGIVQQLFNSGQFNVGTNSTVALYMSGTRPNARIRTSTNQTLTPSSGDIVPNGASDGGWYYLTIRRVGANIEIAFCPKGGTATTIISTAVTGLGAITPNQGVTLGARSDATASNGQNASTQNNLFSYYARVNGTFTNAQLEALAAGQDVAADLGLSPLCYIKFDGIGATQADASGNGRIATRVNAPAPRGGPIFGGAPITVDKAFDAFHPNIHQRAPGGTTKLVTATGTYRGSPSGIMVRVLSKAGAQLVAPATATYPSAGKWSANLTVPQGGEYTLEPYFANDNAVKARSQNPWGVGINILGWGESLMENQAASTGWAEAGFTPNPQNACVRSMVDPWQNGSNYNTSSRVVDPADFTVWKGNASHTSPASGTFAADRAANPARWVQLDPSALQVDNLNGTSGAGFQLASRVATALGIPVSLNIVAKTGTKLVQGSPSNWDNINYAFLWDRVRAGLALFSADNEKIILYQGANDGNDALAVAQATYQAGFHRVVPRLRALIPGRTAAQLTAFVNVLGANALGNSPNDASWRAIRNAHYAEIDLIENAKDGGDTYDLPHGGDALHLNTAGYNAEARREAQAVLHDIDPVTYPTSMRGERVISASISGLNSIDVVFTLDQGTSLKGGTGNAGLTGFVVKDGSNAAQTPTSAVIQAPNTVRLTFLGMPVAGWSVDYVPTQNPDITNPLYSNAIVIGDTLGVPVRAFTAPIVL